MIHVRLKPKNNFTSFDGFLGLRIQSFKTQMCSVSNPNETITVRMGMTNANRFGKPNSTFDPTGGMEICDAIKLIAQLT